MENILKISGRKRIRDRGIEWKPGYHKRSQKLKKRFDEKIGPLSYIRWEGHDYTTDSDYFVVMGPSLTREGKKRFFAGIKKLPDDPKAKIYAPSGEYFTSSVAALSHASEKWAIPFPKGAPNYTVDQLIPVDIPRHVKGENMKIIKTIRAQIQAVPGQAVPGQAVPEQQVDDNFGYLSSYVTKLRTLVNSFSPDNKQQALMTLEEIQTVVQKIIASVDKGARQNIVNTQQAVQQAKQPLIE